MTNKLKMDGERIRQYLSQDIDALLSIYRQFEILLPNEDSSGSSHHGEDGRYVEALIRSYLIKYLPKQLDVATGFILRPGVKTGLNGRERKGQRDKRSTQLKIIVYDSIEYPAFQRFDKNVIVPPESVIGIISVKKHIRAGDIKNECKALKYASKLCRCLDINGEPLRGPFLALVSIKCPDIKNENLSNWIFQQIKSVYDETDPPCFDDVVGYIGLFEQGSIFKARPRGNKAKFVWHSHCDGNTHLGLQFILTGLLSVFYDTTRCKIRRPGFTGFESGRPHESTLGEISVSGLR